jgi:hypothetical protein
VPFFPYSDLAGKMKRSDNEATQNGMAEVVLMRPKNTNRRSKSKLKISGPYGQW